MKSDLGLYNSCVGGAISEHEYIEGLELVGLVDGEVRERITYDVSQLVALIESDCDGASCCCGDGGAEQQASWRELAEECAGKVWSAKIYARKR